MYMYTYMYFEGLPRCKNLWTFSLFSYCVHFFVFFISPLSLTGSYTEDEPPSKINNVKSIPVWF